MLYINDDVLLDYIINNDLESFKNKFNSEIKYNEIITYIDECISYSSCDILLFLIAVPTIKIEKEDLTEIFLQSIYNQQLDIVKKLVDIIDIDFSSMNNMAIEFSHTLDHNTELTKKLLLKDNVKASLKKTNLDLYNEIVPLLISDKIETF